MREFLIFRLYGTMASWGDIAVGEFRPTFDRPSKSAVMGLIAAALGIRRCEEERQRELAQGYLMAIRIDSPGILLRDYHTVQVPPTSKGEKKYPFTTRKDELAVAKDELNTILSSRDYRCDTVYTICLWGRTAFPPYSIETIKTHLDNPAFVLYLGRKSCPLSLPVHAQILNAENLAEVLGAVCFPDDQFISQLLRRHDIRIFWEGDEKTGFEREHTVTRRDDPSSRKRWQFLERGEHSTRIKKP
ncbi:MAG: type I-E CRISPR-associated protein Cas5/CasD [Methanoregula sp.]